MEQRVSIVACWRCAGSGRARAEDAELRFEPCRLCAAYGRLRIIYGEDADGDVTQRIEPQPDSPLPATPVSDKMKRDRGRSR